MLINSGVAYTEGYLIGATHKDIFYIALVWTEVPTEKEREEISKSVKENLVLIQELFNQSHKHFFHL